MGADTKEVEWALSPWHLRTRVTLEVKKYAEVILPGVLRSGMVPVSPCTSRDLCYPVLCSLPVACGLWPV